MGGGRKGNWRKIRGGEEKGKKRERAGEISQEEQGRKEMEPGRDREDVQEWQ